MALSKIDVANMLTGTAPVANGGTGVTTAAALANTGNLVKLSSTTLSSAAANIDFNSSVVTGYNTYKVNVRNLGGASDAFDTVLKFSVDNGSNFLTTRNSANYNYIDSNTSGVDAASMQGVGLVVAIDSEADQRVFGDMILWLSEKRPCALGHTINGDHYSASYGYYYLSGCEILTDNAAINFLRITNNDGSNLTSGTQVTLYGVVE